MSNQVKTQIGTPTPWAILPYEIPTIRACHSCHSCALQAMAALEVLTAAADDRTDTMLVAHTDTMLVPYTDTRPGERVAPSRVNWRSWRLQVDADGTDDNMSAIRSGLLSENGSAPAPPVALVYIHKVASAAPTRMVESLIVLYAGQGRRLSTVARTGRT